MTLVNGKNEIVYTYERTVDPRETTKVMVIHNYYARDTYTTDSAMSDADYIAQEGVKPSTVPRRCMTAWMMACGSVRTTPPLCTILCTTRMRKRGQH